MQPTSPRGHLQQHDGVEQWGHTNAPSCPWLTSPASTVFHAFTALPCGTNSSGRFQVTFMPRTTPGVGNSPSTWRGCSPLRCCRAVSRAASNWPEPCLSSSATSWPCHQRNHNAASKTHKPYYPRVCGWGRGVGKGVWRAQEWSNWLCSRPARTHRRVTSRIGDSPLQQSSKRTLHAACEQKADAAASVQQRVQHRGEPECGTHWNIDASKALPSWDPSHRRHKGMHKQQGQNDS